MGLKQFVHRMGAPETFFRWAGRWAPWFMGFGIALILACLFGGLVLAPSDYQMGDAFRMIYVHVPSAWMSMFIYVAMASASLVALVWRIKVAEIWAMASAPIGASFTAAALITGMLWGKPMWGAYWVWDARLTSELILLFLYLGVMGLNNAIENPRSAARAAGLLAIVGVINIPIIHYSVEWWNSLHQPASITKLDAPSIRSAGMLVPLLLGAVGCTLFYSAVALWRCQTGLLRLERDKRWVKRVLTESQTKASA